MEKYKYSHVPTQMIRNFVTDTEQTITNIVNYGALTFSKTNKVDEQGDDYFFGQFIYMYHNDPANLPDDLFSQMDDYENDGDYMVDRNGFDKEGEFDSASAVEELRLILKDDDELRDEILQFCKFRFAHDFYNLTSNLVEAYKWAKSVEKTIPAKTSTVMINTSSMFDFLINKKTEKEKMRFAVYMGVCSIMGEKKYMKTNKDLIFARALGYHSVAEITAASPELWQKYNSRRRIITFLEKLETEKKIVFYTTKTIRGIYVGYFGKTTFGKMVENIQSKKIESSAENKRREKREMEQRIIERLKKEKGLNGNKK